MYIYPCRVLRIICHAPLKSSNETTSINVCSKCARRRNASAVLCPANIRHNTGEYTPKGREHFMELVASLRPPISLSLQTQTQAVVRYQRVQALGFEAFTWWFCIVINSTNDFILFSGSFLSLILQNLSVWSMDLHCLKTLAALC